MAPVRRQAITRTNAHLLSIGTFRTNFTEIRMAILTLLVIVGWQKYIITSIIESDMELFINFQISTVEPFKFGNG